MSEANHLELLTKFVAVQEKKPKYALFLLKSHVLELIPDNRVAICYHHRLPAKESVEVWYSPEKAKAYYCNLMKCGQVWACPVCAQRLALIRREMLHDALEGSREKYLPLLVTYTAQHYKGQPLKGLLDGMNKAYRRMRQQRIWRTYKEEYLIRGEIRAVEITYGANGWHPHQHVVMLLDIGILDYIKDNTGHYNISDLTNSLTNAFTPMWLEALEREGLKALAGPGLNVRSGWDTLNDYVTKGGSILPKTKEKWGIAEEITLGQLKKADKEGATPWELLVQSFCGATWAGGLFKEYVSATKGKSSLQWSPGLKAELVNNRNEEKEITEEEYEEGDILLSVLDPADWRAVWETGAVGILLDNASTGKASEVEKIVKEAHRRYAAMKINIPD